MVVELNPRLFGWRRDIAEKEWPHVKHLFQPFSSLKCAEPPDPGLYLPPWKLAKKLFGKHLPRMVQESLDCCGFGLCQAGQYLHVYELAEGMQEEKFRPWYPPYPYAIGRTAPDLGNGQLGSSGGSTGVWTIEAVRRYGMLFADDEGVAPYSGAISDAWGRRGVPEQYKSIAANNQIGAAAKLEGPDEVRLAVLSRKMVTYAIDWDYGTDAISYKGYRVLRRGGGGGGHQVCLISWMDEPFPAAFCLNSWPEGTHEGPDNGEPPGGAWLRKEDMARDMSDQFTEIFGMSQFAGEPGSANHGGL